MFASVELMGHVHHVGRIVADDQTFPGLTRIETLDSSGKPRTVWFSPASVYRITEITEEESSSWANVMALPDVHDDYAVLYEEDGL